MKWLPIGNDDFKIVREGGTYYYVDKSMLIADILGNNPNGAYLFTRPRRFGKSLNLSMLDAFFNIEHKGKTWFEGLEISEHPEFDRYRNAFPTVYVKLKDFDTSSSEKFLETSKYKMRRLYKRFKYLSSSKRLSDDERADFDRMCAGDMSESECQNALDQLVYLLEEHHETKVVVLIDEYDNAMNHAYGTEMEDQVRRFVSNLLSPVLKSNEAVQLSVVTGVMQIAKESIFSGVNNLYVDNILSDEFDERFGFTGPEVERLCSDYGHPEKYEEAKDWYDGYRFGSADVYNPWSVLNYVKKKFVAESYWTGTSGNDIIPRLLDIADPEVYKDLGELAGGKTIMGDIDTSVSYSQLSAERKPLYSVMAMSGYLKVEKGPQGMRLSIPNRELYSVFAEEMLKRAVSQPISVIMFMRHLLEGNVPDMELCLGNMVSEFLSVRVLGKETCYQVFMVGLLASAAGRYRITADYESGDGYHDILMECIRGGTPHVVIEVKKVKEGQDADKIAEKALEQIHDREYYRGMKGRVLLYGVAFDGKIPVIALDAIDCH